MKVDNYDLPVMLLAPSVLFIPSPPLGEVGWGLSLGEAGWGFGTVGWGYFLIK